MFHLLICVFSVFISSFSSFFFQLSSSYTELLSILLWYKYPSPDIFTQVNDCKKQRCYSFIPSPKGIQTTKAGFVWGEIEAKGEGILEVPFPAFSFSQISTNLAGILDPLLPFFILPLPDTHTSLPPGCRSIC